MLFHANTDDNVLVQFYFTSASRFVTVRPHCLPIIKSYREEKVEVALG